MLYSAGRVVFRIQRLRDSGNVFATWPTGAYRLGLVYSRRVCRSLYASVSLFAISGVAVIVQDPNKIDDFALDLIGVAVLTIMFFVIGALGVALGNVMMGIGLGKNAAFTLSIAMTLVTAWLLFDYLDAQV